MKGTIGEVRNYFVEVSVQATNNHLSNEDMKPIWAKFKNLFRQILADRDMVGEDFWDIPVKISLSDTAKQMFEELRCPRERMFQRFIMAG